MYVTVAATHPGMTATNTTARGTRHARNHEPAQEPTMTNIQIPDGDGVWTMTDAEFKNELAKAWDEGCSEGLLVNNGWEAGALDANPYRSKE